MQTQFNLETTEANFDLPDIPQTAMVISPVGDYASSLVGQEQQLCEFWSQKRRHSFSSGRHCVRCAQALLGLPKAAIMSENRAPIWPTGSIGSVSHSDKLACAVISTTLTGIGIDIEQVGRISNNLWPKLFTQDEQLALQHELNSSGGSNDLASTMFSAKEAGYKAIYPLGRKFIGFHDAQIACSANTFKIRYLGEHKPNLFLDQGQGYWQCFDDHILTLFTLSN